MAFSNLLCFVLGLALAGEQGVVRAANKIVEREEQRAGLKGMPSPADIKVVHVVQSCHLDVGFHDLASRIIGMYFNPYYPEAISTAAELRKEGGEEGLIFLTQALLVSLYVNCTDPSTPHLSFVPPPACPSPDQLAAFVAAVKRGDIVWHAFPFNAEPELLDETSVAAALNMAKELSATFGLPSPTVFSQRDVPGLTRSLIPHLKAAGVTGVSVGCNGRSSPPAVPSVQACLVGDGFSHPFVWRDPISNTSVVAHFHPGGYGGLGTQNRGSMLCDCFSAPGLDEALCYGWRGDNDGPAAAGEVKSNWQLIKKNFPNARVKASTLDAFWALLEQPAVRSALPVFEQEVGDTWVYGCSSDPWKLAAFRAFQRERSACVSEGRCGESAEPGLRDATRLFLKLSEHTWGGHTYTIHDHEFSNSQFHAVQFSSADFAAQAATWDEQRLWVDAAVEALGASPLGNSVRAALAELTPRPPELTGLSQVQPEDWDRPFRLGGRWSVLVDGASGALVGLNDTATGMQWATADRPLGRYLYRSHSAVDCARFESHYLYDNFTPHPWCRDGLNTSNEHPGTWLAPLRELWVGERRAALRVTLPSDPHEMAGAPSDVWLEWEAEEGQSALALNITWFNKTSTRLPESAWLEFRPPGAERVLLDKLGSPVDAMDVVLNGSRMLHGVLTGATIVTSGKKELTVETVDAPLVSPGGSTDLYDFDPQPDPTKGLSVSLFNNLWDTNYVMWYPFRESGDEAHRFRFRLVFS